MDSFLTVTEMREERTLLDEQKPILLVEDDEVDIIAVQRSLKHLKVKNELKVAKNGEEALNLLKEMDLKPNIILLDINMPQMNGMEFLEEVKEDRELKKIPVIVLTTSIDNQDVEESFKLGAAGYMVKPADYARFIEVIKEINLYWTISLTP